MRVVGVDPGASGAFALLEHSSGHTTDLQIFEMPRHTVIIAKKPRERVDLHGCYALGQVLGANSPDFVAFEDVQGFGKQDAAGAFVFGRATCAAEMALIAGGCALRYVTPKKWKDGLGISSEKENALLEAKRLFPRFAKLFTPVRGTLTKEQAIGNAEAALIAYYGATRMAGNNP
jgi:Holliday junction resolvasome RuvABC endonuclease subunit